MIDLVNEVYGREFGIGYQELVSSGGFAEGPPGPGVVELLLADRDAFEGGAAGWREGEADALADRIAELVDDGRHPPRPDRAAARGRHRRRPLRGRPPPPRAAHRARDRPWVLRPAGGRRPADVPAAAAHAHRRRGAARRAGLAAGRRLERRPGADPAGHATARGGRRVRGRRAAGGADRRGRAAGPRVLDALLAAGGGDGGADAGAAAGADRHRPRLRPRAARAARRRPPPGERPQADPAGPRVRGRARAGSRGVRAVLRGAGRSGRPRGRGGDRRRGRRGRAADDGAFGQGPRVRRRRRRRHRARGRRHAHARRAGRRRRAGRVQGGASAGRPAQPGARATRSWGRRRTPPRPRRAGGCSTSR